MQEIHRSNPPMVTGVCDPNKSQAWHHHKDKCIFLYDLSFFKYVHFICYWLTLFFSINSYTLSKINWLPAYQVPCSKYRFFGLWILTLVKNLCSNLDCTLLFNWNAQSHLLKTDSFNWKLNIWTWKRLHNR